MGETLKKKICKISWCQEKSIRLEVGNDNLDLSSISRFDDLVFELFLLQKMDRYFLRIDLYDVNLLT